MGGGSDPAAAGGGAGRVPVPPGITLAPGPGRRGRGVELERTVHPAQLITGVFKARFEQAGRFGREGQRAVRITGRALHHAQRPRGPRQRGGRVRILRGAHRPVGRRPVQLGLAGPHHLVLDQGVHVGQHRAGGPPVPGHAGRDPGVGDQPGQDAAHVGAVLGRLVPQQPGVCCPGCQRGHVHRAGGHDQQRVADSLPDGGHRVMRDAGERGHRHRRRAAQVHVGTGQHGHVAHGQRLGQLDQQRQPWREPGTPLDALQPRSGHAHQPASTGRDRPLRSRRIWMRSPVRFPARSSSIS